MRPGSPPNPDVVLREIEDDARDAKRGKLVVFFGAAPGVGKTYAMLEAARSERDLKRDVVIGVVEAHGRYDIGALVLGLEMLPRRRETRGDVVLEELDLDEALTRKPGLVLMDELAHTNAPGSRHAKRWQDVEELLGAGIDVYTTLNVQHLESLNDVVAQITGVVVRETVPDRVLEEATEVRLIDLPPDAILERLAEGKIYLGDEAHIAKTGFFREGNLIALRELALRSTAERVDAQMRVYKTAHGIERTWATRDRILVCVSPSPASAHLVRGARRMATSLHAPMIAAYVETPASIRMGDADRRRVAENLRLAETLGAETVTLRGESAAQETLRYARTRNVTKIVLGKPTHPRWRDLIQASFLEEIVRASGDIDVHVLSGDLSSRRAREADRPLPKIHAVSTYLACAAIVFAATATSWIAFGRERLPDVVMLHLLGIIVIAMRYGFGPSIAATVLGVILVDFFFVPPYFSLTVYDFQYVVTFAVMFVVAVVISSLTKRIRDQADAARGREMRTASLYGMSRALAAARARDNLVAVATQHLHEVFDAKIAIMLPADGDTLALAGAGDLTFNPAEKERAVVSWVWEHAKAAGLGTDTLPFAKALYVPLRSAHDRVGVLGIIPADAEHFRDPERRQLLDVFAGQVASALDRARLAEKAERARIEMEAERMRSSLLSSVSHDLRTPLTVITGAASALLARPDTMSTATNRDLLETIHEEGQRLNRLVQNLLDMTRIASGAVRVIKDWQPLEEVVGAALNRLDAQLEGRQVVVRLPPDLPLVPIDDVLVEQLLINLIENATKYTPKGSPIEITAEAGKNEVIVTIADHGPGIPPGHEERLFEKFYRLPREREGSGAGLGLAICRGVIDAHGGRIWVENRRGGEVTGARFRFSLPVEGAPPELGPEELR